MFSLGPRLRAVLSIMQCRVRDLAGTQSDTLVFPEFKPQPRIAYKKLMVRPPRVFRSVFAMFIKENSVMCIQSKLQLKRLSKVWSSLSESEKQPYRDAYQKYTATFESKMNAYRQSLSEEERHNLFMYRITRDQLQTTRQVNEIRQLTNMPHRRVHNSFKMFVLDHCFDENNNKLSPEEYEKKLGRKCTSNDLRAGAKLVRRGQELAAKWRSMSTEQKNVYRLKHEELDRQYEEQYKAWLEKVSHEYVEAINLLKIQKSQMRSKSRRKKSKAKDEEKKQLQELEKVFGCNKFY